MENFLEDVWRQAPVVSDFFRMEPRQGGKVTYKTEVQVVFDKRNLYVGVLGLTRELTGNRGT